jgi:3-hydroxyisobutyrate dehydrogenase
MASVGFIGLGNMGLPMARNLKAAGHEVKGFDLMAPAVEAAKAAGIETVGTAADAARDVACVFTMLPAGRHVKAVYLGEEGSAGVIAAARARTVMIDSSTIDVASARAVHAAAAEAEMLMVDAPVSGGVGGAEAGTLTMMVGGPNAAFEAAKPYLEIVGGRVIHAGGPGNGQVAKVCNNMILGITQIANAEGFTLAEKLGLDPKVLFDISSTSSGSNWAMLNHNPVPGIVETAAANRDYKPGFSTAMMHKDLQLAQAAAQEAGAATPLGAEAAALYTLFANAGNGDLDYSAIVKMIAGKG